MWRRVTEPHINRIATAVPRNEVHGAFKRFADLQITDERTRSAFGRLALKSQIDRRYSVLEPRTEEYGTTDGFYEWERFPSTGARMARFEAEAPALAEAACDALGLEEEGPRVTHLILATCTGFAAPGLDHWLIRRYGIPGHVERTIVGFMGCQAAINALKLARQAVRSDPVGAGAGGEPGAVQPAPAALHRARPAHVLPALRGRVQRRAGHGRAGGPPHGRLPRRAGVRGARAHHLAHRRRRLRHDPVGHRAADPRRAPCPTTPEAILDGAAPEGIDLWAGATRAGAAVLDAVAHGMDLPQARWRRAARCCARTATCPRRR
jgi:hypothetical protein